MDGDDVDDEDEDEDEDEGEIEEAACFTIGAKSAPTLEQALYSTGGARTGTSGQGVTVKDGVDGEEGGKDGEDDDDDEEDGAAAEESASHMEMA